MIQQRDAFIGIIKRALAEDVGAGDITSNILIAPHQKAEMAFVARHSMVVSGSFIPAMVYECLVADVKVVSEVADGAAIEKGTVIAVARGNARALLAGERVALNIMQRMCGIATLTAAFVKEVAGTKAVILDTRKTMPNLRVVDKHAVKSGGGKNHRMRLDDMVLIKDNHIALNNDIATTLAKVKQDSRLRGNTIKVVVECDTLEQVAAAIAAKPDRILLDNMSNEMLAQAVAMSAGSVPLEASGGVTLATVRDIAQTGVDYISVGALTHSVIAADIGADIVFT